MRPAAATLIATWLLVTTVGTGAVELPRDSRRRAERYERWRDRIESAEDAAAAGRLTEAEAHYLAVIEQGRDEPTLLLARALDGLADLRRHQGRLSEAEELYGRSIPMWEALLGPSQPRLATSLHNLGTVQAARGDCAAARRSLERALEIWSGSMGRESAEAGLSRQALGSLESRCAADAP